ncbi:MAG: RNA-binding cell elongation regulator Jag/EloR [Candidatus Fimadaptatus sp.]
MRSIESTGKTVEEAVQAGLARLNLELSDVTFEVIDEGSKGFFGLFGAKPAKVRITERDQEPEIDMDQILRPGASTRVSTIADKPRAAAPRPAQPRPEQPKAAQPKPAQPRPTPPKAEQPRAEQPKPEQPKATQPKSAQPKPVQPRPAQPKAEQPRSEQPKAEQPKAAQPKPAQQARPVGPKPPRQPRPARPHEDVERAVIPEGPLPDQDPATLSEAGKRAYEYLDKLTRLMGVSVKIYVAETSGSMSISMMGDTLGILIGRRGDTLDALQYLTSLEVNRDREDYIRVSLDTEHYRAKREDSLTRLAARMADRAVKSGRKVVLEPMNPYERRVLHATLQNHPYVQTHSEGEEPNRRVVITLKADAPAPEAGERTPARPSRRPERRPERRGDKPGEHRERGPRPERAHAPRPEAAPQARPADTPMAHDVPEDPTDDTI